MNIDNISVAPKMNLKTGRDSTFTVSIETDSETITSQADYHLKTVREKRVTKELNDLQSQQSLTSDPPFTVELVNDNIFEWQVKLFKVDRDSDFGRDMENFGVSHILLNVSFPKNFPFSPPVVTVQSPTIRKGFVTKSGVIFLEILTPKGWTPAYTMEAIIMQFAASLVKGHGRIQQVRKEYNAENNFEVVVDHFYKYGYETDSMTILL